MRNLELAEQVLAAIEDDNKEDDSTLKLVMDTWAALYYTNPNTGWSCGTAACLAGHVLIAAGGHVIGEDVIEMPGGHVRGLWIGKKAAELLGLRETELYDVRRGSLWSLANDAAVARFRELIKAERARRSR